MEALSVCANIIAVIQITAEIISLCYDFRAALNQSPWSLTRILDEVTDLRAVLEQLERSSQKPQANESRQLELICRPNDGPLASCDRELSKLLELLGSSRLFSGRQGKARHALIQALGWRLKDNEVKASLGRIERCKSTLNLALAADERALLLDIQELTISLNRKVNSFGIDVSELSNNMQSKEAEDRRRNILRWLCPVDPYEIHETSLRSHVEGTGSWFLNTKEFTQWEAADRSFLWVTGPPGTGKTILFSTAAAHLLNRSRESKKVLAAYFYFDFRTKELRDGRHALGSLIAQLALRAGEFPLELEQAFDNSDTAGQKRRPSASILKNALEYFSSEHNIVLLVDALDECTNLSDITDVLDEIRNSPSRIKVLITSRDEPEIRDVFGDCDRLRLENYSTDLDGDIELYTTLRLKSDHRLSKLHASVQQDIATRLHQSSAGMFRWVQCQLDSIAPLKTVKGIMCALDQLPKGLDETYSRILRRVVPGNADFVRKVLVWLSFSVLPLRLEEVHEAIAIEPDSDKIDETSKLSNPLDILSLCGSLISMSDQGYLNLAHLSVKDFLLSDVVKKDSEISDFAVTSEDANLELATSCLQYLSFREFSKGPANSAEEYGSRLSQHTLLRHAAQAWPYYVRAFATPTSVDDQILTFMSPARRSNFMSWVQVLNADHPFKWGNWPRHATPLYYAASFGLARVVTVLVDDGAELNVPGSRFGGTALHAAAFRGHVPAMRILLAAGADPNKSDFNKVHPLHSAAACGHTDAIKLLLEYKASYDAKDEGGETPLDWADKSGQGELLRRLINDGREVGEEKFEAKPSSTSPKQPLQVWTRQATYFPSFYEKRSGMHSSIVVDVQTVPRSMIDRSNSVTSDTGEAKTADENAAPKQMNATA